MSSALVGHPCPWLQFPSRRATQRRVSERDDLGAPWHRFPKRHGIPAQQTEPLEFAARRKRRGVARSGLAGGSDRSENPPQRRTRLVDLLRSVPRRAEEYFRSPWRRALFGGIALFGGFYVAQTISLSFGALSLNDVAASVICVLFTEFVTQFYHSRPKPTFYVALLNVFKMGFIYGLFIDAFKLAS